MSQFDSYTSTKFVENLRRFLNLKKRGFLKKYGFSEAQSTTKPGRIQRYPAAAIAELVEMANRKAARVEAFDTTLGERIRNAKDYHGLSDAALAKQLDVSRELVRRWCENLNRPKDLSILANVLNISVDWLTSGGCFGLAANSHLGVRVGDEALKLREQLYSMTLNQLVEFPESADLPYIQSHLEWAVFNNEVMSRLARHAGGRWQTHGSELFFAPWVPIHNHGLSRRYWSDEVERIIDDELGSKSSTYGAWHAMKQRCEELGFTESQYPKKITLYKRIENEKRRQGKFGMDINSQISATATIGSSCDHLLI